VNRDGWRVLLLGEADYATLMLREMRQRRHLRRRHGSIRDGVDGGSDGVDVKVEDGRVEDATGVSSSVFHVSVET
jgi:hypothetical protein